MAIVGPVGVGKSSLLSAILSEMSLVEAESVDIRGKSPIYIYIYHVFYFYLLLNQRICDIYDCCLYRFV